MPWRGLLAIAILLVLSVLTWTLLSTTAPVERATVPAETGPDYDFAEAEIVRLDPSGRIESELDAARIWHFPHDDSTVLETVALTWFQEDGGRLVLTAERGRAESGGRAVDLAGSVRVVQLDASGVELLEALTTSINVLLDKRQASTRDPVHIRDGSGSITGTGMFADLAAGQLRLLANVNGIYAK